MRTPILILTMCASSMLFSDHSRYRYSDTTIAMEDVGAFSVSYKNIFPLGLACHVDSSFNSEQKQILQRACYLFLQFAIDDEVLQCSAIRSNKDLPSDWEHFKMRQMFNALSPQRIGSSNDYYPTPIYIAKMWDENGIVGLGFFSSYQQNNENRYFHIALNSDYLASPYYYGYDAAYWAGVIGHEVLHNLGYHHPNGYPGSFINEYGFCIHARALGQSQINSIERSNVFLTDDLIHKHRSDQH